MIVGPNGPRVRERWSCDPEAAQLLAGSHFDVSEWVSSGRATIVKNYSKVLVLRIQSGSRAWYLKWYRLPGLRLRIKAALGASPAARFRAGSEVLAECGFRGPRLVASAELGPAWLPLGSVVVTEEETGAIPLDRALAPDAASRAERRARIRALGRLFRDLHAAGVLHKDLKDANILARVDGSDAAFTLLDLEDVRRIPQLSRERRLRSLMQIFRTLGRRAPVRDLVAFLQGYYDGAALRRGEARVTLAQVQRMGAAKDERDRGRVVRRIDHAGYDWLTTLPGAALTEHVMSWGPEQLRLQPGAWDHRVGRSRTKTKLELPDGSRYLVRFYQPRNLRKALLSHERRGRSRREWDQACEAGRRAIPTLLPEARAHDGARIFRTELIAYPLLEGATDLATLLADPKLGPAAKRSAIRETARVVRLAHDRGMTVRHLRPDQILFISDGTGRLIDLERARFGGRASWRERVRDLADFDRGLAELVHRRGQEVPRSQRLRFVRSYLDAGSIEQAPRRVLAKVARQSSRSLLRRERRRRRSFGSRRSAELRIPPVSCFVICKDEDEFIRDCLESVCWCQEIVVVDSFSTDRTVEICREYTDRVFQRAWPGFVEQKRYALGLTRNEWVLNLDADERISPKLRDEIVRRLTQPEDDVWGYYIPRLVFYLGRWWTHGWYPEYRLRLFRKSRVTWGGVDPHERAFLADETRSRRLKGDIFHLTYRDLSDQLHTINRFTSIAAREAQERGKRFRALNLLGNPVVHFLKFYVVKRGFLDGIPGLFMAGLMALHVFLKYAKLWELEDGAGARDDHEQQPAAAERAGSGA